MSQAPRLSVLATGNELLTGTTLDTHSRTLSQLATSMGLDVRHHLTVGDDMDDLLAALSWLHPRSDLIFMVGGLGPTVDDLTQAAVARHAGRALVRDENTIDFLKGLYKMRGFTLHENNLKQADFPEGSTILQNPIGTAPGFALQHDGVHYVALPGVPWEFHRMVEEQVTPRLPEWLPGLTPMARVVLCTFGSTEAGLDRRIKELPLPPSVRVGFRSHFPEIDVVLLAPPEEKDALSRAKAMIQDQLGPVVFSEGATIAEVVRDLLEERELLLGVVESCTGGLLGSMVTSVPGSSNVFDGGALTYSNEAKTAWVDVPPKTLEEHGAVSEATAVAMAQGLRARRGLDNLLAISITGISGPGGGTPDKPVGTVWMALAGRKGTIAQHFLFKGDREQNRVLSARTALELLRRQLLGLPMDIKRKG